MTWKRPFCRNRWLWSWTWLNTNKHTMTLWGLSCEMCTPSSPYMSQTAVWTAQCKAISLSAPPPPHPHLISSIPKQKLLLWEKRSATCVPAEPQTRSQADSFGRQHVCIQCTEHFSFSLRALRQLFDLFKITSSKQSPSNLAHPNIQVKVSTRISKRWSFIGLAEPKEQCSSLPSGFDLAAV